MDSFISSVPGSNVGSAATSPMTAISVKPLIDTPLSDSLVKIEKDESASKFHQTTQQDKQDAAIENLKQLDPLAMVLELVEVVQSGQIAPKDVYNAAGPIRLKLNKAKTSLQELEGLDQSIEKRREIISDLKVKIARQTDLLKKFQERMGVDTSLGHVQQASVKVESPSSAMDIDQPIKIE